MSSSFALPVSGALLFELRRSLRTRRMRRARLAQAPLDQDMDKDEGKAYAERDSQNFYDLKSSHRIGLFPEKIIRRAPVRITVTIRAGPALHPLIPGRDSESRSFVTPCRITL